MKGFILFLIIPIISPLLMEINQKKFTHCYTKSLLTEDKLFFSFLVSSAENKTLVVNFTNINTHKLIYQGVNSTIEYKSETLKPGDYQVCFEPKDKNANFYLSFQFYSFSENGIVNELAIDKEVKYMMQGVNELKESFHNFETNFKYIVDRRTKHNQILNDIIASIKNLTLLKIFVILFLSIFQVFIIEKFFGPDKRVSTVKGVFSQKL